MKEVIRQKIADALQALETAVAIELERRGPEMQYVKTSSGLQITPGQ